MEQLGFIRDFGLPLGFLMLAIYTGWKKVWVFGWAYEDEQKRNATLTIENTALRDKLFEATTTLSSLARVSERVADAALKEKGLT